MKTADCTVVELRRYRLQPGARDSLVELFDREFVESQEAVGMHLLGQFRELDDPDSFVWLRGFRDTLTESASLEFPDYFVRQVEPVLREAGASVPATYATEHSPNTFPALPVREDVEVFVSFNVYADEARHARHVDELNRSPAWREELAQELAQRLDGSPEVLRLRPTARSLLRG